MYSITALSLRYSQTNKCTTITNKVYLAAPTYVSASNLPSSGGRPKNHKWQIRCRNVCKGYNIYFISNCSAFVGLTISYNIMHGTYNIKKMLFFCFVLTFYLENMWAYSPSTRFCSGIIHRNSKTGLPLVYAVTPLRMRLFAHASRLLYCGVGPYVVTINPALSSSFVSQRVRSFRLCACIIIISQTGHRK